MGQTNKDCRFRIFTLTNSLNPATFACWKIRFKTEVCTCSQFPSEATPWIKEVEMVESVDDLESSRSIKGTHGPDFELLDARNASALNKIIQNTRFKKKVSLEEMKECSQRRPFPSRKTDSYLIYEQFLVTGPNDSVENYAGYLQLFFKMTTFKSSIRNGTEFFCR